MIHNAINASQALSGHSIRVFPQGSYRNDTNVRQDSDVDICVCCTSVIATEFEHTPDLTLQDVGLIPAAYTQAQFKEEVGAALRDYFGSAGVTRNNKVFDVHANSVRVDADVAPCFELRLYSRSTGGQISYTEGTRLVTDRGELIMNFPEQHYRNGTAKNNVTGYNFKRLVRILKRLRNEMAEIGLVSAGRTPSYLLESLAWNVPDGLFRHANYKEDVRGNLVFLYESLEPERPAKEWLEINGVKYLFHEAQRWTQASAREFTVEAWNHIGFE